jgi:hypothetical protein
MDTSRFGVARIRGTKVIIVTRNYVVQTTLHVIAGVVSTKVIIATTKGFNHASNGRITGGNGTRVGCRARDRSVRADTIGTRVDGTVIGIAAINGGKGTSSIGGNARICRTRVVVVAYDGGLDAISGGARADRTGIVVVAVDLNVRATACSGAGAAHGVGGTRVAVVTIEARAVEG